jgi:hypothetical protein
MKVPIYQRQVEQSAGGVPGHVGGMPDSNAEAIGRGLTVVGQGFDSAISQQRKDDAEYQRQLDEARHKADVTAARNALTQWQDYETTVLHGSGSQQQAVPGVAGNDGASAPPSDADISAAGEKTVTVLTPEPGAFAESLKTPDAPQGPGFLQMRGMDAVGSSTNAYDALKKRQQDLLNGLTNDKQRELFQQESDGLLVSSRRRIEDHAAQQIGVGQEDSLKSARATALNTIANNYTDPSVVQQQVSSVIGPAHALLAGRPAAEKQFEAEMMQDVASTRLNQYIANKDWKGAQTLYSQVKDQLGIKADHFENVINIERDRQQGDAAALQVVNSARKPNGFIDEAKAVATFEAIPKDTRSDAARVAFDHFLTLEKAHETSVKSDNFDAALSAYLQNKNINDVPPATKAWMIGDGKTPGNDPKAWQSLLQISNADGAHARGAGPSDDQRRAMTQFEVDLHDHPDKYATMSEPEFHATVWPMLSKNDRERAGALFATAHGQAAKPGTITPEENNMLLQKGRDAGLFGPKGKDPAQWDGEAADFYYKATEVLREQATAYRRAKGEAPPFKLMEEWTNNLLVKGKIPGSGYFGTNFGAGGKTRLEALTKGPDTKFEPEWTDEQKSEVVKGMRARGIEPTDQKIDSALRAAHGFAAPPVQQPAASATSSKDVSSEWGLDLSQPTPDYGD